MKRSQEPAEHGTQLVNLSPCGFAFWWLFILGVHVVTCAYSVFYAKLYWGFESTLLSYILAENSDGMPPQDYQKVAFVYMALTAVHGICALSMIVGSLWNRELAFRPRQLKPSSDTSREKSSKDASNIQQTYRVLKLLSTIYHRVAGEHGLLGVQGKHFHAILICRELVEVTLQTVQAIRMSKYLPRMLLNRFYVGLLVINCWSSVFVYSRWFWRDEARRRFVAILCDCVLNMVTTVGVSLIITLSYIDNDVSSFEWPPHDDDDGLIAQMLNESRVVLVVSWFDLASRTFFSIGLVATTEDMKALLRCPCRRKTQVGNMAGPSVSSSRNLTLLGVGTNTKQEGFPERSQKHVELVGRYCSYKETGFKSRSRQVLRGAHAAFAIWGVVMLSLHIHASSLAPLHECTPKVHPMAGYLPSCFAVTFSCHNLNISGSKDEVRTAWSRFDRSTTARLHILHCRSLQVPDNLQDFDRLQEIIVYNSTIASWESTAAITNTHHPSLAQVYVIRANMSSGLLPLGLQAHNFPTSMGQIVFCETNLEALPDDLDVKWRVSDSVLVENSKLTAVPISLVKLQLNYLGLSGNPISELPPELFSSGLQAVLVDKTLVNELPLNVDPTGMIGLDVSNTNISFFPSWIDPLAEALFETYPLLPLLTAGGSNYCSDLEAIMSGFSSDFSTPVQPGISSSLLMNASEANWDMIRQSVDCSQPLWSTHCSLEDFDEGNLQSETPLNIPQTWEFVPHLAVLPHLIFWRLLEETVAA
jgi:hypothetical protein